MSAIYLSESHRLDADARERALQALQDYLSQNLGASVTRHDAELVSVELAIRAPFRWKKKGCAVS